MKSVRILAVGAVLVLSISLLHLSCVHAQRHLGNLNADPASEVSSRNIGNASVLWKFASAEFITHKPIVEGGRVYFADWGGSVYAADATSGKPVWQTAVQKVDPSWAWHGFCGTGVLAGGVLYEASAEGTLFALSAASGDLKWQVRFTDRPVAGNIGTLLCYKGMVYVPVSSMDEGLDQQKGFVTDFQGSVVALDAGTGRRIWEFMTVTGEANGAAVWGGFALDPETETLFFGTGNNYTGPSSEMSDAIIAVDAMTGKLKWSKQCTQQDVWTMAQPKNGPDYDFGAAPQVFEAAIDGKTRKLVAAGQKSGTFWVLDAATGDVVWKAELGTGSAGGGFIAPASIGQSGIYAWANGGNFMYSEPEKHPMDIAAFDPATGRVLWKDTGAQPAWLTEAGFATSDIYLVGSLDGKLRAYRTSDGNLVWTSEQMSSISTSILVAGDKLYFGTGIPKMVAGTGDGGVLYCLRIP
jgi:polyvinyl alcohol dehydrogenase (cytochrome)